MNIIIIITNDCKLSNSVLTNICIEQESCGRFKPIRSALIHGICLFEDGIGVARRQPVARASLRSRQSSYVIPSSEATWESPKKKQKPFDDCHKPHSPSRLLPHREFVLSVRARTRTPATVAPNYLLGGSRAGHPHPIELHSSPRHSEQRRGI